MSSITLEHIDKVYPNGVKAVSDFNLDVKDQEFIIFVGPSGCGKSTTLRMIAGLEDISAGTHKIVFDNMAFGLKIHKVPKDEISKRVHEAAEILGLEPYLDRKPKALSGG